MSDLEKIYSLKSVFTLFLQFMMENPLYTSLFFGDLMLFFFNVVQLTIAFFVAGACSFCSHRSSKIELWGELGFPMRIIELLGQAHFMKNQIPFVSFPKNVNEVTC